MPKISLKIERYQEIDALRGFAIFTMVAANLAGNILNPPHPFLFRFYGTFAAPIFIILSGMMVAMTNNNRSNRSIKYYLIRGLAVVFIGVFIDLAVWQYSPFTAFDVLYLIGISMPITYLATRLSNRILGFMTGGVFLLTPLLQSLLGYNVTAPDVPFTLNLNDYLIHSEIYLHRFLIDGWFPLFPWLGFSLFGASLYRVQLAEGEAFWHWIERIGLLFLAGGALLWYLFPGGLFVREGYSELFYPATLGYILTALGVMLLCYRAMKATQSWGGLVFLNRLGQCALLIYVVHYALIRYVFNVFLPHSSFPVFLLSYASLIMAMIFLAYAIHELKKIYPKKPAWISFLIGG